VNADSASSPWLLRPLEPSDYEALTALLTPLDVMHHEALPHLYRPVVDPVRSREFFLAQLAREDVFWRGAVVGATLLGFVCASCVTRPERAPHAPGKFVRIDDLMVHAEARRRGIGRALIAAALDWARTASITDGELNVFEFNAEARAFYERLGFSTLMRRFSLRL
jgi:GNAT superfamily N-acetyltransferase